MFSGWGRLVYYDPDEHKITNNATTVARISKMASEWKIIQDFKPTDYPASHHLITPRTVLSLSSSSTRGFMLPEGAVSNYSMVFSWKFKPIQKWPGRKFC